jgi:hypothetical protein
MAGDFEGPANGATSPGEHIPLRRRSALAESDIGERFGSNVLPGMTERAKVARRTASVRRVSPSLAGIEVTLKLSSHNGGVLF